MRKRTVPGGVASEPTKKGSFELFDNKTAILAAYERGSKSIVLEGRKFVFALTEVSNVEYVIVSPEEGHVPCANLIRSMTQYEKEMNRRASPAEDRRERPRKR